MKLLSLNIKEIKTKIGISLNEVLAKEGFIYKKSSNQFICSRGDYNYFFHLIYTSWSDHYSIDIHLYIGQKKVEGVLKDIIGCSNNITIGNEIGVIYNSPNGKEIINRSMPILIIQDQDVEAAVETLQGYYNKIGKTYFDKYSSLLAMDNIINNAPFDYNPAHVGGGFDDRCMKGLIIARLVDNPNYDELIKAYDKEIKETPLHSINNYEKVREYLTYNNLTV
jgi:hypothetical protein